MSRALLLGLTAATLLGCESSSDSEPTVFDPQVLTALGDGTVRAGPIPAADPDFTLDFEVLTATATDVAYPNSPTIEVLLKEPWEGSLVLLVQINGADDHYVSEVGNQSELLAQVESDGFVAASRPLYDELIGVGRLRAEVTLGLRTSEGESNGPVTEIEYDIGTFETRSGNPTNFATAEASCGGETPEVDAQLFGFSVVVGSCYFLARDFLTPEEISDIVAVNPADPRLLYRRNDCAGCDDAAVNACSLQVCRLPAD